MDCENCEVVEMCRKMFGKYWPEKSSGGKGCEHPVYGTPKEAMEVVKESLQDAVIANPPLSCAKEQAEFDFGKEN